MSAKLDAASMELARSMNIASIPEKLRCATCDKLAINAVKLPCCDNTICGDCHDTMSATECPICTHSPFSADMCVPAKGLQMTIKAFIKTERKKRGAEASVPAMEPSTANHADTPTLAVVAPANSESATVAGGEEENVIMSGKSQDAVAEAAAANPVIESEVTMPNGDVDQGDEEDEDDDVVITTEMPEQDGQQHTQEQQGEQSQQQYDMQRNGDGDTSDRDMEVAQQQQNFGIDQNQNMGNFGNGGSMNMNMGMGMGMNGFNGMMPNFGMNMPNMMGMPGMGMDPSMMFNGNFGGMGDMSMMGMGMGGMGNGMMGGGVGNFGGMGGPGFFPDQGNYMQSNYGNAQRQNFSNDRGYGRGFGRGFGRGARGNWNPRGGRGGGWGPYQGHQQQNGFHQPHNGFHQAHGQQNHNQGSQQGPQRTGANSEDMPLRRASPVYEGRKTTPSNPGRADDRNASESRPAVAETNVTEDTNNAGESSELANEVTEQQLQSKQLHASQYPISSTAETYHEDEDGSFPSADVKDSGGNGQPVNGELSQIQSVDHSATYEECDESTQYQQGYGYGHHNDNVRGHRNRGGFGHNASSATELTPAPAPPANAPKGPKAMLQGLPNTGWSGRNLAMATPPKQIGTPTPAPQSEPRVVSNGSSKQDEIMQEEFPVQESYPIEQDKADSRPHSHSRRRSRSLVLDDGRESDGEVSRRKEGDRRKRKDRGRRYEDDTEDSERKYRSRSESRNDNGSRRRHRDKNDEQYRSSRTHRDRSRDRDRRRRHERVDTDERDEYSRRKSKSHHERAPDQDDSKDSRRGSTRRHSRRDDDYGHEEDRKERSHRSSRHERASREDGRERERESEREHERNRPRTVIEPPSDELGFKIKGSRSARAIKENSSNKERRSSVVVQSVVEAPAAPAGDIYAAERAAAQQSREAREAQRRGTVTQPSSLGKRGREEEDPFDAPRGPKNERIKVKKGKNGRPERKISYKYEDEFVGGGNDDRDANRWR